MHWEFPTVLKCIRILMQWANDCISKLTNKQTNESINKLYKHNCKCNQYELLRLGLLQQKTQICGCRCQRRSHLSAEKETCENKSIKICSFLSCLYMHVHMYVTTDFVSMKLWYYILHKGIFVIYDDMHSFRCRLKTNVTFSNYYSFIHASFLWRAKLERFFNEKEVVFLFVISYS